jgi:hypothetical protein
MSDPPFIKFNSGAPLFVIQKREEPRELLRVSNEGVLSLGPGATWDEAAEFFLDAVERAIRRRVVAVDKTPPSKDEP